MTINIMDEYIKLTKKQIETYMKLVFERKFIRKYNDAFMEKYINIRYYDFYDDFVSSTIRKKILDILRKTAEELMIDNIADREIIEKMCTFFYYVLYFDNVVYFKDLKEKIMKLNKLRKRLLDKENQEFTEELYNKMLEYSDKKQELLNKFNTDAFTLKITNYSNKINVYRVNLKYNIILPKVYSEYAKNKAFNIGIINEDKLKIEYYLIVIKILQDVIKLNFKRQYIVEFADTILKKPQKLRILLKTISNGAIQDKICLKIRYEKFLDNKEKIYSLMQDGFKIAIILDNSFETNYKNIESLEMFKFIIVNKETKCYDDLKKYRNKKIKNKIIEI